MHLRVHRQSQSPSLVFFFRTMGQFVSSSDLKSLKWNVRVGISKKGLKMIVFPKAT